MDSRCVICDTVIAEGLQVCKQCEKQFNINPGENIEIAEELRDISGVLSITANTDGNIKNCMESILRIADRLEKKDGKKRDRTKVFAAGSISKTSHGKNI